VPERKGDFVPVRITNRSRGLLTLELNSGASLYLAPGEMSGPLAELEVADNQWVQRLLDRDQVQVEQVKDVPGPGRTRRSGRGSPKR
jgi:hypothetical protein